ncbi:MAG: ABC transporter ATP-binding protein [Deltaproteobacteria bacterium RIFCSPLOWO2_12_FULL_43_16]|nr:MAG: ABC transporter ATP-binding protein [Deltaproteobacteria bacterium GWA2_43_19]OGQ11560.1 MAG: ABC transporter ATP-binding protein [Deltaproteobacteria bacterium RIFCSPHIGHO2_02_FULL_43_33]OGQ34619.1 MAG: ABC transporter ATP-binding protein [Deltaproteobacteria bacterium RIFCSPLOWO2_01_FULL_42_9]OGQ59445.1 MAG: ABC transporter ATP-binding protein [Deltaproteobacteria bacterium RIFCSPLOWO2_12_FULL_43_16]
MQTNPIVEVKGLTKIFNSLKAVDNISFEMYPGEILGLLGPNGAGKTTTLQMLLALTTPTSGDIKIFGLDLQYHREKILQSVNFSSSYVAMPYSLTVMENLMVFARLYNVKNPQSKILELLKDFESEYLKDRAVRNLSSGQITRVCLIKALLSDPKILFLDEPTASLDPDISDKTRRLLKKIKKEKDISILYSSHNMKEMEEMSDRIIFLDKGRIIAKGRPEEVRAQFKGASLEDVFLKIARGI